MMINKYIFSAPWTYKPLSSFLKGGFWPYNKQAQSFCSGHWKPEKDTDNGYKTL